MLGGSCLALAAGLLPGCTRPATPLRIGLTPWPANDLYALAEHLGYYDGVPLRIVDHASAEQGLQALRNGVSELFPCTLDEAILLSADLPDLRVVQVIDTSFGADAVLAHADVPDLQGLRGRRIGYEATALGAYVLSRALATAGLGPADVTPVFVQVDEHERAFLERRVDAVVTYEPVLGRLVAAGARNLFDSTQMPGEIVDVLVTRASIVESRSDVLVAVVGGWLRAVEALRVRPKDTTKFLARRMALPPEEVGEAFPHIHLVELAENRALLEGTPPRLAEVAQRVLVVMQEYQLVGRPPRLETLFDARIVARLPS